MHESEIRGPSQMPYDSPGGWADALGMAINDGHVTVQ